MRRMFWLPVAALVVWPILVAAVDPLQRGRDALWVIGGLAGVVALASLLLQPLLAIGAKTGLSPLAARHWHRWVGLSVAGAIIVHVGALLLYSPDDMWDALLLTAPTPFSLYGVIGLWTALLSVGVAIAARKRRLPIKPWQIVHSVLAVVIVGSGSIHALMIDGAMGQPSKTIIVVAALAATTFALVEINVLRPSRFKR